MQKLCFLFCCLLFCYWATLIYEYICQYILLIFQYIRFPSCHCYWHLHSNIVTDCFDFLVSNFELQSIMNACNCWLLINPYTFVSRSSSSIALYSIISLLLIGLSIEHLNFKKCRHIYHHQHLFAPPCKISGGQGFLFMHGYIYWI